MGYEKLRKGIGDRELGFYLSSPHVRIEIIGSSREWERAHEVSV